jgi:rubrerythrin
MGPAEERLLGGLREAIIAEQTGVEFYSVASHNTADLQGREVFEQLAREEAEHQQWLKRQYGNLLQGRPFEKIGAAGRADLGGPSPVFSEALKARVGEAHWEMTALAVGLALEDSTITRYRALAQEATQPDVRRFFEELARWEEGHAEALRRQSNLLKESYWTEARFWQF